MEIQNVLHYTDSETMVNGTGDILWYISCSLAFLLTFLTSQDTTSSTEDMDAFIQVYASMHVHASTHACTHTHTHKHTFVFLCLLLSIFRCNQLLRWKNKIMFFRV